MNSLTNQMSSLGQQQSHFGNVSGATPTQPMSTPLRPPTVNATPFCSPTGYGLFGSGNVSQIYSFVKIVKKHNFTFWNCYNSYVFLLEKSFAYFFLCKNRKAQKLPKVTI